MTSPPLPPSLRAKVLGAARAPSSPRRSVRRARLLQGVGAAIAVAALTAALGVHPGARPPAFVAALAAGFALIAAMGAALTARGRSMLGPPRARLVAVAALVPVALGAWLGLLYLAFPVAAELEAYPRAHAACFAATFAFAAAPLAAAVRARGADPLHPGATAAALAACAAALAAAAMLAHCPASGVLHMALGHLAPVVVIVAAGAAALGGALALRSGEFSTSRPKRR